MSLVLAVANLIIAHGADLVGFILPPFVDVLNKEVPNEEERFIVTLLTCFLVALFLKWDNLSSGNINAILSSGGIVFLESQLLFRLYFKNSFLRQKLQDKISKPTETEMAPPLPQSA